MCKNQSSQTSCRGAKTRRDEKFRNYSSNSAPLHEEYFEKYFLVTFLEQPQIIQVKLFQPEFLEEIVRGNLPGFPG